jgi:type IV secretory pathway TrbL component
MKTKFCLTLATALLALTAFSYGQAGDDMKKAADDTGSATKKAAVKTGHATKKAAVKTGDATETAAKDTGHATKTAAKDTGKGVKKGTKAVGHGGEDGCRENRRRNEEVIRRYCGGTGVRARPGMARLACRWIPWSAVSPQIVWLLFTRPCRSGQAEPCLSFRI